MKVKAICIGEKPAPAQLLRKIQSVPTLVLEDTLAEGQFGLLSNDGDCKYVATALMIDLYNANVSGDLRFVKGIDKGGSRGRPANWQHLWVELDGWVLDASNTFNHAGVKQRNIYIIHAPFYYKKMNMTVTSRKKPKQFRAYLDKCERRG